MARAGGGQPLDEETRAYFEPRLRVPLHDVRVHTDPRANAAARSVRALAYTTGQDIVFRDGQYAPASAQGRRLLAHELAHVVQQRSGAAWAAGLYYRNWLRAVDQPRFDAVIQGYGGAPVMIVLPLDPSAARRDSRAAQRLVEQVRSRLAARRASASSSGTTGQTAQQTGTTPPQTGGTPPPTDTRTPQQRIGEPPDRVSVWSNEQGVYARVEVDRAATSIELDDGESPEGLESRIQDAADDLRRSRDPASSVRIASGATTTGFTGTSQTPPGQAPQGSQAVANAPAYPATIQNFGPEVTVPGAVTRFQMQLDYRPAGSDTLSQVAARMQHINYYWELLDRLASAPDAAQGRVGQLRSAGASPCGRRAQEGDAGGIDRGRGPHQRSGGDPGDGPGPVERRGSLHARSGTGCLLGLHHLRGACLV